MWGCVAVKCSVRVCTSVLMRLPAGLILSGQPEAKHVWCPHNSSRVVSVPVLAQVDGGEEAEQLLNGPAIHAWQGGQPAEVADSPILIWGSRRGPAVRDDLRQLHQAARLLQQGCDAGAAAVCHPGGAGLL